MTAGSEKLGVLVCTHLHAAAAALVEAARLDDVRLIPFPGNCSVQSDGWHEIQQAATMADDCRQFRLLAGRCVPDAAPSDFAGRPALVLRGCPALPEALSEVGRGRLGLLIDKAVLERRVEAQRERLNAMLASASRRLADSSMVQEMVSGLTETMAEESVVEKVFDVFAAIMSPATIIFAALEDGRLTHVWSRPAGFGESDEVRQRLVSFNRSYDWTESGAGFRLSLRHQTKTLGVIEVDGIASPEHREHYLEMAQVVARASALAIADARFYRELRGPDRTYLEYAEDLQDALIARKRAEEKQAHLLKQVEAANQDLNTFAHAVSHDLKAPLWAIDQTVGRYVDGRGDKLDSAGREMLDVVRARISHMRSLIEGILQYSRAGQVREDRVAVDLSTLLPKVIYGLSPPDRVKVTVETELPTIVAEKTRIEQVFQNLLSNAVKYNDKPAGLVQVGVADDGELWRFYVKDNGPGIPEKDFERIFQLFQTTGPHERIDSTGVGLAVVKRAVEMYGGRVWVESKVGEGSTFFFTYPKHPPNS